MKNVLTLSAFDGVPSGHGGEKRTLQVVNVVKDHADRHEHARMATDFDFHKPVSLSNKIIHSPSVPAVLLASRCCRQSWSVNDILSESHRYFLQNRWVDQNEGLFTSITTVVWENNYRDFFYLPYLIKKHRGMKVIGCPQNIESLVPGSDVEKFDGKKSLLLQKELEAFAQCDLVFTISEEDQWLLNLLGIPAGYLPFFPTGELLTQTQALRERRLQEGTKDFFLILGSVWNPPTFSGMHKLLQDLETISSSTSRRFKVAGYGTEAFREQFKASSHIEIVGAVSQGDLTGLMEDCSSMIINQGYSTGALTKVPEVLLAGVPMMMNAGAARSYRRLDGVYVYESKDELADLLKVNFPIPAAPKVPSEHYKRFVQAL